MVLDRSMVFERDDSELDWGSTRVDHSGGMMAKLPGRYASAWFSLAVEDNALARSEADGAVLQTLIAESPEFSRLLTSPLVDRKARMRAVAGIAKHAGLSDLTARFLGVVARNGRLSDLSAMLKAFAELAAGARGEVKARVTSAHALTAAQLKALGTRLEARVGRPVLVDHAVDADLLGGLTVQIGSELIDGSIRTQLHTLAHAMKG